MLLLTLRGTPTLYYGDEIGMTDVPIAPEAVQDPWEKREPGLGLGRDPQRTPMQWNGLHAAGFTSSTPWLPVGTDYPQVNVAMAQKDPASILALYRNLIALRRRSAALTLGSYRAVPLGKNVLAYERFAGGERLLIVLNFDSEQKVLALPAWSSSHVLLSTQLNQRPASTSPFVLRPDEGVIFGNAHNRADTLHDQ